MSMVFRWTNSRKCPYCERRWPPLAAYELCPACREDTSMSPLEPNFTAQQAATEARYFEFGWWLWEHDADS